MFFKHNESIGGLLINLLCGEQTAIGHGVRERSFDLSSERNEMMMMKNAHFRTSNRALEALFFRYLFGCLAAVKLLNNIQSGHTRHCCCWEVVKEHRMSR